MEIFDYALKMERDAEKMYRDLAEKNVGNPGVKKIMTMLADEEARHYKVLNNMKSETPGPIDSKILSHAKEIFRKMKEGGEGLEALGTQVELYRKAQELEKESEELYEELEGRSGDDRHRNIFHRLAEEEKRHYFLLDNIVEFVSRPETWLENAEWHHLEEY